MNEFIERTGDFLRFSIPKLMLILLLDGALFYAVPLGVDSSWENVDTMCRIHDVPRLMVFGCALPDTGYAVSRIPSLSTAVHERVHIMGYGEEVAYPAGFAIQLAIFGVSVMLIMKYDNEPLIMG